MKIIDITRELFAAPDYDGDPAPRLERIVDMSAGSVYNLSALAMCVHNGTHMDAPLHFIDGGADAASLPLSSCIGECTVVCCPFIDAGKAAEMAERKIKRLIIKGGGDMDEEAAPILAEAGILLVGTDGLTVGPYDAPAAVHRTLLSRGVVLLENLELSCVSEGEYTLYALPMKIAGAEGAPCRALLCR